MFNLTVSGPRSTSDKCYVVFGRQLFIYPLYTYILSIISILLLLNVQFMCGILIWGTVHVVLLHDCKLQINCVINPHILSFCFHYLLVLPAVHLAYLLVMSIFLCSTMMSASKICATFQSFKPISIIISV